MPELDPVRQDLVADATEWLATLDDMIAKAEAFAAAAQEMQDALVQIGLAADDAAVTMGAAAGRANDLADAALKAGAAADAAAGGIGDIAAASALSAAALGGIDDKLGDLIMLSAASVSELHDLRDALLGVAAASAVTGGGGGGGWGGWWGALTRNVTLFGGALNGVLPAMLTSVAVWHILADATIEFGTTLLEAGTAVVAFGAFAAPTFQHIYVQLSNIWTASNALNTAIYPLQASFSGLDRAVQPEAYELFGEAIVAVNQHTNEFQQLASSAGLVLDQLGGRLVAAIDSGNGFSTFLTDGTRSLSEWGTIVGNVGGIFGNFFRTLPGYANLLTHALEGVTGALEAMTGNSVVQWFMEAGLAVHGFLLWVGLAVTALLALRGPLTSLAGWVMGGIQSLVGFGVAFVSVAAEEGIFEASMLALERITPFGWVTIAVVALTALGVAIGTAKDQAQEFNSTIQQTVQNASLGSLSDTLASALASTQGQVASSTSQVSTELAKQAQVSQETEGRTAGLSGELAVAKGNMDNYRSGASLLTQQTQLLGDRVSDLSKTYGGAANAWALLNEAGITSSQILSTNTEAWKAAQVQIAAVAAANQAMALGAGRNAAAMNALNYAGDTTNNVLGSLDVDMQKVTTGMSDITNVVLGAEQAVTSFESGLETMSTDAQAAGAAISGVSPASVTLTGDFYNSAQAMQSTINAMELQLPTTKELTNAVGIMAQQLLPVAGNNQAAEASIITLINNALGPGTVSFKNLNQWVQANGGSLATLNGIIGETTVQASVLANTLDSDLNASFASDILKATGAQQALSTYTQDLANNTQNTAQGQGDRAQLIKDLEQAGLSAQQAETYVGGLATALGKIVSPPAISVKVNFIAEGSQIAMQAYSASGGLSSQAVYAKTSTGIVGHGASGGMIGGYGTGTSDSNLIRASRGEYIVNAAATAAYRPLLDAVNAKRYASGGVVGSPGLVPTVLEASLTGGGGDVHLNHASQVNVHVGGRRMLSEIRSQQLTFERRNSGTGLNLGRQGTPR